MAKRLEHHCDFPYRCSAYRYLVGTPEELDAFCREGGWRHLSFGWVCPEHAKFFYGMPEVY